MEYADAQFDDARLAMMLVRSAVDHGAVATNYTAVTGYLRGDDGRVQGVRVREETSGEEFDVHARAVILAGGVWTQEQQELAGADGGLEVLASKGAHITVPRDRIRADAATGVITKTEKSVLFLIPWDEYWVIGTTDTPWAEDVAHPATTADDIDYILEHANAVLKEDLTRDDVIATYAGLRPLLQPVTGSDGGSTKISREHTVTEVAPASPPWPAASGPRTGPWPRTSWTSWCARPTRPVPASPSASPCSAASATRRSRRRRTASPPTTAWTRPAWTGSCSVTAPSCAMCST